MTPVGWPVGYHASLRQEVSDITELHALTHPTYIHIPHSNAHMTGTVQKSVTKNVSCCIFIKKISFIVTLWFLLLKSQPILLQVH